MVFVQMGQHDFGDLAGGEAEIAKTHPQVGGRVEQGRLLLHIATQVGQKAGGNARWVKAIAPTDELQGEFVAQQRPSGGEGQRPWRAPHDCRDFGHHLVALVKVVHLAHQFHAHPVPQIAAVCLQIGDAA